MHPLKPWDWDMAYLLQFCGLSDPLKIFYLEQRNATPAGLGPAYAGFRPFQLDGLLEWALESARCRSWDGELIRHTVMEVWMAPAFRKDVTPLNRKSGGLMEQTNPSL